MAESEFAPASQLRHPRQFFRASGRSLRASTTLARRLFVRDVRSRYRQSVFGLGWIVLPALAQTGIWLFLNAANIVNGGDTRVPYPVYVLVGTLLWQSFSEGLAAPNNTALELRRRCSRKVRFPVESVLLAGMADVGLNTLVRLVVAVPLLVWYGIVPGWGVLFAPVGVVAPHGHGVRDRLDRGRPFGLLYPRPEPADASGHRLLAARTPVAYTVPTGGPGRLLAYVNPVSPLLLATREWLTGACARAGPGLRRRGPAGHHAPARGMGAAQALDPPPDRPVRFVTGAAAEQPVITVEGLGKKFARDLRTSQRYGVHDILDELRILRPRRSRPLRRSEFWALEDVSFDVRPGEALGIVGHNGAGKSTLLRMLNGLLMPDAGSVTVRSDVGALIELGAPFSTVLNGRENIAVGALMQGVDRREVDGLTRSVAEFAELEHALDAPVQTYSTGMQMRLGYAIVAQASPGFLLVDEVIAVGDIGFQRKCVHHIIRYLGSGGALIMVSHDMFLVQAICSRCLVMENGRVVDDTTPNRAIASYLRDLRRGDLAPTRRKGDAEGESGEPAEVDQTRIIMETVAVGNPAGAEPRTGESLEIDLQARSVEGLQPVAWQIEVLASNLQVCLARVEPPAGTLPAEVGEEGTTLTCRIVDLPLFPGIFHIAVHAVDPDTGERLGGTDTPVTFEVEGNDSRLETMAQMAGILSRVAGRFEVRDLTS